MIRFLLFLGCLIGLAYVLTTPQQPETAFNASEPQTPSDKPLLTSWGPTLGSLRNGVGTRPPTGSAEARTAANDHFHKYGPKTELWVLGQSNGFKDPADPAAQDDGWVSDGYVATASLDAARNAAEAREASETHAVHALAASSSESTRVAALDETRPKETSPSTEPVVDRIAAALPPQRRGLFGRVIPPESTQADRTTRQAEAPMRRGLFKRLMGRSKQPQRVFALGPAR